MFLQNRRLYVTLAAFAVAGLFAGAIQCAAAHADEKPAAPPEVGDSAEDFALDAVIGTLEGNVRLSTVLKSGPAVVVVLRGYPGYQCPICSRQVGELISKTKEFTDHKTSVLLIYPGPAKELDQRAKEFVKGSELPAPLTLLLDPDYSFTNAYGLRWDAPRETAYPSTFVIDTDGTVRYAKISKSHGDRAEVSDVIKALDALK